jgi:hypothetical protein
MGRSILRFFFRLRRGLNPVFAVAAAMSLSGEAFARERVLSTSAPMVKERRAHENEVEYVSTIQDDEGGVHQRTNRYVVLATGLNRWDSHRKSWVPANNEIEMVNGRGVARGGQHRVTLAPSTKSAGGMIDLETPQGERITLQPVGLAATDASGRSVFIAEVKESAGLLSEANVMTYPDAFDLISGSICVRVGLDGIESDVILSERIDRGLLEKLGIEAETAKLEVWHQVLRKPHFKKRVDMLVRRSGKRDEDHTLEFGGMSISPGTAFPAAARDKVTAANEVPVAKELVQVDGTDFLIESVPFLEAEPELKNLPEPLHAAWSTAGSAGLARLPGEKGLRGKPAERQRPISISALERHSQTGRQVAMASGNGMPHGYVIDYPITLATQTNFTFRGDTTYFVTNRVLLYGLTCLEGGAVVKTIPYSRVQAGVIVMGTFECATSPLVPAIFTGRDDNTVGETVAGSTGIISGGSWYSAYNLAFMGSGIVQVHDVQTRHAQVGLYFRTPGPHSAWNVQGYGCNRGIEVLNTTVYLRNALLHQTVTAINPGSSPATQVHAEHLTIDTAANLFGTGAYGTLYLTNSLLANVGGTALANAFFERVETVGSEAFKIAGRGRQYLADGSPHRNAGTSSISSEMRTILNKTTTSAPSTLSGEITSNTTLNQVTPRDTDAPDLGFHYYPLDYLASGIAVDGVTLTLNAGVRVGVYGPNGFVLRNGGSLVSQGEAQRMNALVPFNAVQVESLDWGGPIQALVHLEHVVARLELQFTEAATLGNSSDRRLLFSGLTDTANTIIQFDISHCRLANFAQIFRRTSPESIRLFNNVIERCAFQFEQGRIRIGTFAPLTLDLRNNLFHKGSLLLVARLGTSPWVVRNNFFNVDSIIATGFNASFAPDYNGFCAGLTPFAGANNRPGIDAAFQEGPLGSYYFGSSGSMATLINAGSQSASDAGLAHFTTQSTPFSREGESLVDIGFHYATVDSNGALPDSDGDGILDKDEDVNMNGRRDPGETSDLDRDTDLDGDSDPDELRMGTDPRDARSVKWRGLASWRFDETLTGVDGQQPIIAQNTAFAAGIESRALDVSSRNGPVILRYRGVEDNGAPNVSMTRGSFRFRLMTFWASNDPGLGQFGGVGPQEWVTLIETANLAVRIDPHGTNIVMVSRAADGQTVINLQGSILLDAESPRPQPSDPASSFWYDVLVTYSPDETRIFWGNPLNQIAGTGIIPWNGNSSANQFVSIGAAPDGTGKFNGAIDDLVIYNVPGILQTNPWNFSAIALTNPTALNLVWRSPATNGLFDVKRRVFGETNWTWLPGAIGTNILDAGISQGQRYEYNLNSRFYSTIGVPEPVGNTITACVLGAPIESRGKVLLLVDETLETALQPELNTLITNLVGDGWGVLRTSAPRHIDDYSSTAAFATNWFNITNRIAPAIRSQYAQFPTELKHILILGHVSIPYTGETADDGHFTHRGPWASDLYYSDIDGIWHDTKTVADSTFLENRNSPQDGKLDDDFIPANSSGRAEAEMTVARIDFARLPAFSVSEAELLKRYLQKNARYRHKQLSFDAAAMGGDFIFGPQSVIFPDRIATETASKLALLKPGDNGDILGTLNRYAVGIQSSGGYVDRIRDAQPEMKTTAMFGANALDPACAFYLFRSSFFQDWNLENDFMRAVLTPANGGLASTWFTSLGAWRFDPLGAGLELGSAWRERVNTFLKPNTGRQSARATQILGDSTLRFPVLAPPSDFTGGRANGMVNLTWTASTEPGCTYNIYRAGSGISSEFVRLNSAPLTGTTFSEPPVTRGAKLYMLRAVKVTETGSGSFTNLSQGIFVAK